MPSTIRQGGEWTTSAEAFLAGEDQDWVTENLGPDMLEEILEALHDRRVMKTGWKRSR